MIKTLEQLVKEQEAEPTNFDQLKHALHQDVAIVLYTDLDDYRSLPAVFEQNGSNNVVIFYPVENNFDGHYVALLYYPEDKLVNYFCPYGYSVSKDIKFSKFLATQDHRTAHAMPMLIQDFEAHGGRVQVNPFKVQSESSAVSTCGKHCTFRILNRDIQDPEDYMRFLKYKGLTPDQIVTLVFM